MVVLRGELKNVRDRHDVVMTAQKKGREEGRQEKSIDSVLEIRLLFLSLGGFAKAAGLRQESIGRL